MKVIIEQFTNLKEEYINKLSDHLLNNLEKERFYNDILPFITENTPEDVLIFFVIYLLSINFFNNLQKLNLLHFPLSSAPLYSLYLAAFLEEKTEKLGKEIEKEFEFQRDTFYELINEKDPYNYIITKWLELVKNEIDKLQNLNETKNKLKLNFFEYYETKLLKSVNDSKIEDVAVHLKVLTRLLLQILIPEENIKNFKKYVTSNLENLVISFSNIIRDNLEKKYLEEKKHLNKQYWIDAAKNSWKIFVPSILLPELDISKEMNESASREIKKLKDKETTFFIEYLFLINCYSLVQDYE